MKTMSLAILALVVSAAHSLSADTLAVSQYAKSMNVVFPGVKDGVSLTNFPALVRLSPSIAGFSYADFARPNGGDLRFADANGNLLPHEIDTWNPNGVSTVWVKVPRLEKNAAITAHYGFKGTGNPASVDAKDVWDDDYVGVWHLGESELPLKESSATSSDFDSQYGSGVDYAADGVVGGSVEFNGAPRNSVVAPDHDALDGFSRFTIEVWTFQDELFAGAGILSKRTSSKSNVAYSIDNQLGSGNAKRTVLTTGTSTSAAGVWSSTLTPTFGEWNHYAYTVDMASKSASVRNVCGYLNGTCPSATRYVYANTMPNCASDLYLGNLDVSATPSFKGRIDEVRISKTVRSADWILATHDTIANVGFSVCVFGEVDYGENIENMLLKAATDKPNPIDYVENEDIQFNFRIDGITNTLPLEVRAKEPLCVIWERTADDGVSVKGTNTISLAGGCTVTTRLAVPGIIRMDAYLAGSDYKAIEYYDASNTKKNITFGGGAGVATERMQMSTVEPADFDQFWARAKAKLAAVAFNDSNVELTPVTPVGASSYTLRTFNFYAAKVPCVGSTGFVTGWLVIPKNAQPGSLPARVYFDGYSATIRVPTPPAYGTENTIVFRVNAHGYDLVGRSSSYYANFANTINHTGEVPLRETYALEASDYEDPEDTYLYYMALRAVRAFDYLKTRPEWDGKNLIAIGGSQGGLQTMWAGGLVDGISEIKPYITWGCDIGDPFIDKDHPWPTQSPLLSRTWGIPNTPNAYYFDAALHAKRVPTNCVATITRIGLGDKPCPMRGVLLSYYNMPCAVKSATLVQGADHLDESIPPQPNQVYTISSAGGAAEEEPEQTVVYGALDASQYAKSINVAFPGVQNGVSLANFPALVRFSTSIAGFSYADFTRSNGGDLRFADANGNLLPHEIDTWDPNGVSTVWVKVPMLDKNTTITAHYGFKGTGNPAPVDAKDVWDDDYVGVWHLGESALPLKESSKTSSDFAMSYGSSIQYAAAGVVGGSVNFGGGAGNSVVAPDHDALDGFSQFTIEAWTLEDKFVSGAGILGKRGASSSSNAAYFIYDMGREQTPKYALFMGTNAAMGVTWTGNLLPAFGEWNHLVYTVDMTSGSSNVRGYKNGTYTSANSVACASAMPNCASDLVLGNVSANNQYFPFGGRIDEVRISKVVRSAEWVKATHDTIVDAGFSVPSFGEVGPSGNIENLFLKARTDKDNPIDYAENETIRFNFTLGGVDALPTALQNQQLYVIWERTADDNAKVVGTNLITFAAGCSVETRLAVPGIVRMEAYLAGSDYKPIEKSGGKKIAFGGSAGVATEKMQLSTVEPADFDAFWADAKAKLATVPFTTDGSELTEVFPSTSAASSYRFYAAKIPCFGPRPVTGWLVVPRNATPGTLPIQAQFDGYGCIASRPSLPTFGQGQRVSFLVNAHGYDMVGHDDQYYRDFYNSTKGYALSAAEYATPTNAYLYGMALRVMRAYDYLKTRPEWNGRDIEALGGSQGGLQAMWAGGLVEGITQLNPQITWGCDIANPDYLGSYPSPYTPRIPNVSGAYYFDAVLHAKRIPRTCDVDIMRIGMGDKTSPIRGVLLSYYNVKCKASAKLVQGSDHDKSTVPNPPYQEYTISKEASADDPTPSNEYGPLAMDLYAKSMSIAFLGVQEGVTLADFPALVRLSASIDGFSYADFAMPDGGDLRFADANGNLIPHEIDTWNPNGVSTVWVKVPQLVKGTTITAHYGFTGSGDPAAVDAKDVWDEGYVGVWHLGESALPLKESSGVSTGFTKASYTSAGDIGFASQGVVGGSVDFKDGARNSISAPDHDALDGFSKFTVEVWTFQDEQSQFKPGAVILGKRGARSGDKAAYFFYNYQGSIGDPRAALYTGTSAANVPSGYLAPAFGEWNHLAYSVDMTTASSNVKGYSDGECSSSSSIAYGSYMPNCTNDLVLGNFMAWSPQGSFNGAVDEVRISKVVRSAEWIKATHDTIADENFTACSVDGHDKLEKNLYAKSMNVAFPGVQEGVSLTDFPALVRLSADIDGFSYADFALPDGGDLRFADANGNLVPHEIDTWNPNGVSTVWVKVPQLVKGTTITAHYGFTGSGDPAAVDAKDVWDEGYVGVWHLGESALPLMESSGVSTDFTKASYTSAGDIGFAAQGVVGGSVDFKSGARNSISAPDHDALDGFSKFTVEVWTFQGEQSQFKPGAVILGKRGSRSSDEAAYFFYNYQGSIGDLRAALYTGTSSANVPSGYLAPAFGKWNHLAYSVDMTTASSNVKGYSDGECSSSSSIAYGSYMPNCTNDLVLGNFMAWSPQGSFNGAVDEVRISKVVRSAEWIKATHDTIADENFSVCSLDGATAEVRMTKTARSAKLFASKCEEDAILKEAATEDPAPSVEYGPLATNLYAKSMNVVFLGVQDGATLTDFPALVRLSPSIDGFDYTDFALPEGGDLRFADASGNLLPHEIDTWNSNGVSTVWVKVPQLVKGVVITAHYGFTGSGEPAAVDAKDVWDEGYVGVWHLGESELPIMESSGVSTNITNASYTNDNDIAFAAQGVVGGSVDFKDGGRNSVSAPDHDALDGFSQFTIEAWTFLEESQFKPNSGILGKRSIRTDNEKAAYFIYNYRGGTLGDPRYALYTGIDIENVVSNASPCYLAPTFGQWNHIAYSVDMTTASSNVKGYSDGKCATTKSFEYAGIMPNCTNDLAIGNLVAGSPDGSFKGAIDEVRISRVVRSAEWIRATHDTIVNSGFAFCTFEDVDGVYVVEIPEEGRINITRAEAAKLGVETVGKTTAEIGSALAVNGANGIPLWQSYVLGLYPVDATLLPQVAIEMFDGIVELKIVGVDVNAMSGAIVTYKVYGTSDLADMANAQQIGGEHAADATAEIEIDPSDDRMFYRLGIDVKGY